MLISEPLHLLSKIDQPKEVTARASASLIEHYVREFCCGWLYMQVKWGRALVEDGLRSGMVYLDTKT